METIRYFLLPLAAISLAAQVQDTQTLTRRFPLSGAAPEVVVSVVTGGIRVTTHSANEVAFEAKVQFDAPNAAALADLKQQVRLESEQSGDNVWIGVETDDNWKRRRPRELGWRGKTPAGEQGREGRRWSFRHDIELKVPPGAHLKLSAVNGGAIDVDGVSGEFHLNNVNGGVTVKRAAASGRAHTVNGPVSIAYEKNPAGPVSAKTVNGPVQLSFPRDLNAEFQFKTLNGKVFSDFPIAVQAAQTVESSERGMKRIWRAGGATNGRVGSGGPAVRVETLNGEIHILQNK